MNETDNWVTNTAVEVVAQELYTTSSPETDVGGE